MTHKQYDKHTLFAMSPTWAGYRWRANQLPRFAGFVQVGALMKTNWRTLGRWYSSYHRVSSNARRT